MVYRNDACDAAAACVASPKDSTTGAAISNGDHQFGIGYGIISTLERFFHVDRYGSGNEEQVRLARTSDKLDTSSSVVSALDKLKDLLIRGHRERY